MKRKNKEIGQGMVEYALIILLIGVGVGLSLQATGRSLRGIFCDAMGGLGSSPAVCSASLFSDDFSGNLSKWNIARGNWNIENGRLCGGPRESRIFTDPGVGDNYVINIKGATIENGRGFGVFYNASDPNRPNGYQLEVRGGRNSSVATREWYRGRGLRPTDRTRTGSIDWSQPRDIQIVVEGNTFTTYVDGTRINQTTDTSWGRGQIGLRTFGRNTKACFDSISVDPLP